MSSSRTGFVTFIAVISILNALLIVFGSILTIKYAALNELNIGRSVALYGNIIIAVLSFVFSYKLLKLKKDVIKWTHIFFGVNFVFEVVMITLILQTEQRLELNDYIGSIILTIIFWPLLYRHLKKNIGTGRIVLQ